MRSEILVTGAGGQLGSIVLLQLLDIGQTATGVVSPAGPRPETRPLAECDLTNADATAAIVRSARPERIIHTAALTRVAGCFRDPARAVAVNVDVTLRLTELAAERRAQVVLTSTDLVFDGQTGGYDESANPRPETVYGRTKLEAERIVLSYERGAVVRLPLLYGLPGAARTTTFLEQLRAIRDGKELRLYHDEFRSPLWLEDAAAALRRVAAEGYVGLVHAGGPQRLSRLAMGEIAASALGARGARLVSVSQREADDGEPRAVDVSLRSERFERLFGSPPGRTMAEAMPAIAREFAAGREVRAATGRVR